MLVILRRELYLMLVLKKQCQCINTDECAELGAQSYPDESVLRRTEVLFCGWVHKFTLESVLRRTEVLFLWLGTQIYPRKCS